MLVYTGALLRPLVRISALHLSRHGNRAEECFRWLESRSFVACKCAIVAKTAAEVGPI